MAFLTFLLLGTENIGIQIEEPFRVLPLEQMAAGTVATVRAVAAAAAAVDAFAQGLDGAHCCGSDDHGKPHAARAAGGEVGVAAALGMENRPLV
jgi:hypothetical protein